MPQKKKAAKDTVPCVRIFHATALSLHQGKRPPAAVHNKVRSVVQTRQACKIHCSVSPVYTHSLFTQDNPGLPVPTKYRARGRLTGRTAAVVRGCGGALTLTGFSVLMNNPDTIKSPGYT